MIAERYIIRKQQSLGSKNMSIGPATCWHQHTQAHPMCSLGCFAGSRTGSSANVQSSFSNPGPLHQAPCVACESAPSPSENAPERSIASTPWDRYVLTCLRSYYWEQFETIYGFTVYQRCFRMSSGCFRCLLAVDVWLESMLRSMTNHGFREALGPQGVEFLRSRDTALPQCGKQLQPNRRRLGET